MDHIGHQPGPFYMSSLVRSWRSQYIAAALMLIVTGSCNSGDLGFSSETYHYSVSLPAGWLQIPETELARFKERLPPQGQHLIYDAAFQRGNAGKWFEWPYLIVQVIPPDRTNLRRLPTEAEFQQVVTGLSSGRTISKMKQAFDAVPSPTDKAYLNSLLPSLAAPSVQVDIANRKYQFLIDGYDPAGPMNLFVSGTFMPDGSVIQLNAYTKSSSIRQDLGQFLAVERSLVATISRGAESEQNCSGVVEQMSSATTYVSANNFAFQLKRSGGTYLILFLAKPTPGSKRLRWRLIERIGESLNYCIRGQGESFSSLMDMHLSNPSGKYGMPGSGYPRCVRQIIENGLPGSLDIRLWANKELGESVIYYLPNDLSRKSYVLLSSSDSVGAWVLLDVNTEDSQDTCYYARGDASDVVDNKAR